jgi:hypothetical protein
MEPMTVEDFQQAVLEQVAQQMDLSPEQRAWCEQELPWSIWVSLETSEEEVTRRVVRLLQETTEVTA